MAMVINTNLASLQAQRHLTNSRADMETAMERLSSGKRINQAGDDAAGLTIAHQMDNQIASLNQAQRNANDGIAMINMAEGAMDQFSNMLVRMKELATQSQNGIYSSTDRTNMDAEFQALQEEVTRIADVTIYNGINVLNTNSNTVYFQVGETATDQIDVTFQNMSSSALGAGQAIEQGTDVYTLASNSESVITGVNLSDTNAVHNAQGTIANQVAGGGNAQRNSFYVASDINFGPGDQSFRITINGQTFNQDALNANSREAMTDATLAALADQINDANLGVAATLSVGINNGTADTLVLTGAADTPFTVDTLGIYTVSSNGNQTVNHGSLANSDIKLISTAKEAMYSIDKAIEQVDSYRSSLGAVANQLEHTAANLETRVQYTSAARSRIMDADYAVESANLAKAQVLQQAGTAMLAQANASTQNVLSLLK